MTELWQNLGLLLLGLLGGNRHIRSVSSHDFGDEARQALDYYQSHGDGQQPVVLFFYGGNWRSGKRRLYRFMAARLCSMGFDVIIPDYRLYPEVRFKDIITDAREAAQLASQLIHPEQPLVVMGHSAGAQLGSLLCLDESLLGDDRNRISGFIGLAGPYDFYPYSSDFHWELFEPEEDYPLSQPVNFVRPDAPPMYLLHGRDDQLLRRGQSKSLMQKMQALDAEADREVYDGMGHIGILLGFSVLSRKSSKLLQDVEGFIQLVTRR